MQIGFVHFDREDQKKYLAVLSQITEGGAIDELGIGRLRDYYSDRMFPGISTLHQHAKYFSLMPLLYREAVKARYPSISDVRPHIRSLEIDMTRRLCEGSPGAPGITGSDALRNGNYVKYDPMYIYGMGLLTYGIVRTDNVEAAIYGASRKYHERPEKLPATNEEQGDSDDGESLLNFCTCPSDLDYDWLKECRLELTSKEAACSRGHMLSAPACNGTLLHHILDQRLALKESEVPTFETFVLRYGASLPPVLAETARKAGLLADLVEGLYYRYNWLYSNESDSKMLNRFQEWYSTVFLRERWSFHDAIIGVSIHDNGSIKFCDDAIQHLIKEDWTLLDYLIKNRERRIKVSRYKIGNEKAGYHYDSAHPIHDYRLQFRWGTVLTMVNEILGGLADE